MHGFLPICPQCEAHQADEMRLDCVGSLWRCDGLGEELRSRSPLVLPCRSLSLSVVTLRTSTWLGLWLLSVLV